MARRRLVSGSAFLVAGAITLCACTETAPTGSPTPASAGTGSAATTGHPAASADPTSGRGPTALGTTAPATPDSASPTPTPSAVFDARAALRDIDRLAGEIGPREATSAGFDEAAELVQQRLEDLGYDVDTESVRVPAGDSWGTPVRAGTSRNVVADPEGFDATARHVVVVAHLDTVSVAPGAEDNASGIAVMLELARLAAAAPPAVPVRFIAFGAEEPRGSGDALHHFGSQKHVAELSRAERDAIDAVVALDRVGVRASFVPVCSALSSGNSLRSDVRDAAGSVDVRTRACSGNTTSDHWSYAKAGVPAVRLGSIPYAAYHSRRDIPDVVDRRQIDRVGRVMWSWLRGLD